MGAILQYDDGPVLFVSCDICPLQIVAFGNHDSTREELDLRIVAEGWNLEGESTWRCKKCGKGVLATELPPRIEAITVLTMPD